MSSIKNREKAGEHSEGTGKTHQRQECLWRVPDACSMPEFLDRQPDFSAMSDSLSDWSAYA